ncbi:MAG: hypothetical protein IK102_10865 [Treponema sp.]|nr:hypothetical protein [Treponema sp.]
MELLKKLGCVFVILLTLLLTFLLRSMPKGTNWNDYKILYIQNNAPLTLVNNIFDQNGIKDYVSLDNQRVPIMLKKNSIEESMLRVNLNDISNRYLALRQNYFYDSTGKYMLYYIPSYCEKGIDKALGAIQKAGYEAGLDASIPYMWLLPVIFFVLVIILTVFAQNKLLFFMSSILPVAYITCNAFHAAAIAAIILELAILLFTNMYKRKGAVKKFLHEYILFAALGISIVTSFSAGVLSGFIFILVAAGSFCMAYLTHFVRTKRISKYPFQPVLIRTARNVKLYNAKVKKALPVITVSCVLIIAYFAFGNFLTGITSSGDKNILLPGNSSHADERLPGVEDYYRWNWNVFTSPYKSLNVSDDETETVVYPRFTDQNNEITRYDQVLKYDQAFKNRVYDGIDSLDFNSIEAVIKKQGRDFNAGYTDSTSYNISFFSIIMMVIGFCMLLFIYFSAMIGKGGRR